MSSALMSKAAMVMLQGKSLTLASIAVSIRVSMLLMLYLSNSCLIINEMIGICFSQSHAAN